MSTFQLTFNLTGQRDFDEETGQYWGFYQQFPNIIAIGDTQEQFEENLRNLFISVVMHEKKEFEQIMAMSKVEFLKNSDHQEYA